MTKADINAESIAALLEKVTPEPWKWGRADPDTHDDDLEFATGDDALWGGSHRILTDGSARGEYGPDIDVMGADAELIAAAPDIARAYLDLSKENERLKTNLAQAKEDLRILTKGRIVQS